MYSERESTGNYKQLRTLSRSLIRMSRSTRSSDIAELTTAMAAIRASVEALEDRLARLDAVEASLATLDNKVTSNHKATEDNIKAQTLGLSNQLREVEKSLREIWTFN